MQVVKQLLTLLNILNFCLKYLKGIEIDIKHVLKKDCLSYSESKLFRKGVLHFFVRLQATFFLSEDKVFKRNSREIFFR